MVRARELAPDDPRVIRTSADLAARRGQTDEARAALNRGLQLHPTNLSLRLALATLELKTDRPAAAADCLEEGRKALKDEKLASDLPELVYLLAEARLQQDRMQAVEDLAAEARQKGAIGVADYLAARLEMHRGRWGAAARSLEDALTVSVYSAEQAVRILLCVPRATSTSATATAGWTRCAGRRVGPIVGLGRRRPGCGAAGRGPDGRGAGRITEPNAGAASTRRGVGVAG